MGCSTQSKSVPLLACPAVALLSTSTDAVSFFFQDYRDVLNQQLSEAFPELAEHLLPPPPAANGVDSPHTNGHANGNGHGARNGYDHISELEVKDGVDGVKMEE